MFDMITMDKGEARKFIREINGLDQKAIKHIGLENRSLISKIIDFVNGSEEVKSFFYFGFSENPIITNKKNAEGKVVGLKLLIDNSRFHEELASSNAVWSMFKGLCNFFGRVGSEKLDKKIKHCNHQDLYSTGI